MDKFKTNIDKYVHSAVIHLPLTNSEKIIQYTLLISLKIIYCTSPDVWIDDVK